MKYDATLNQFFERSAWGLLRALAGGDVTEWINVELPRVHVPRMDLLASISTRNNSVTLVACSEAKGEDSGELKDQLFVAEPRHWCGLIGQTRGDQIRIVSTLIHRHHDRGGGDFHFA